MPKYSNGQVPRDVLELIGSGTNADGYWEHLTPFATAAKIRRLVELGRKASGKTLRITAGYNCFRPLQWQQHAWEVSPPGIAAWPGSSSHGGTWQGAFTGNRLVDTAAIDFANWGDVFGSYAAFAAACREVGLMPGIFSWEPWHVFDFEPYGAIPAAADVVLVTLPERLPLMPDVSLVLANGTEQWAAGPNGRVHLNGQTSVLFGRWFQFLAAGGNVDRAGGMTLAEMDILIADVLSQASFSAVSIVRNVDNLDEQWAVGPGGRYHLNGQEAALLARWLQFQIGEAHVEKAGGLSVAELDVLIGGVFKTVTER